MLDGELYTALDEELLRLHDKAQEMLFRFNSTRPAQAREREIIIKNLFGAVGASATVKPPFFCDYGSNIIAGDKLFINYDCVIIDCNKVYLGDNLLLAPKVHEAVRAHSHGRARRALLAYDLERRGTFRGKWLVERVVGLAVGAPALMNHAARALAHRPDLADLLVGVTGDFVPATEVLRPRFLLPLLVPRFPRS